MGDSKKDQMYKNTGITMVGRLLAAAAAVACCFLLYRFAQAYFSYRGRPNNLRRGGSRRRIPIFGGRKDALYSALSNGGYEYEDEEGDEYHDDDYDAPPVPARNSVHLNTNANVLDRPLPELPGARKQDKPLPPLPESGSEPE